MTQFQLYAMLAIAVWLGSVALWFQRSRPALLGGLLAVGAYALIGVARGDVTIASLGLGPNRNLLSMAGLVAVWLGLMLAWSPVADRIATRWFARPPTLDAFKPLQQSRLMLAAGIVVAWILGGFLEELVFRGVLLQAVEALAMPWAGPWGASALAIAVAALGAGIIHLYQGPRAALIIVQLSALFGLLFVVSGRSLWAVILCHGLYDTIAFIRFASGRSRYSKPDPQPDGGS